MMTEGKVPFVFQPLQAVVGTVDLEVERVGNRNMNRARSIINDQRVKHR